MVEIVEDGDLKWFVDEDYPASKEPIRENESHILGFCIMISGKDKVFVDVGACTGKYTIPMSKHYGKVIAIEPNPKNVQYLKRNIELNDCSNIEILELAVSNVSGKTKLSLRGAHSRIGAFDDENAILVLVDTLDNLVERADVVKVDVEGVERQVVEGSERLIEECKPVFIIEHGEYWHSDEPKDHLIIMRYLTSKGYYPFNYNYAHWIYVPKEWIETEEYDFAGKMSDFVVGRLIAHHIFYEIILRNLREGKAWYHGLPNKWWWGMSILEFISFLVHHAPYEKEWLEVYKKTLTSNYGVKYNSKVRT